MYIGFLSDTACFHCTKRVEGREMKLRYCRLRDMSITFVFLDECFEVGRGPLVEVGAGVGGHGAEVPELEGHGTSLI